VVDIVLERTIVDEGYHTATRVKSIWQFDLKTF
jgi:hypothetical protein